jgi:hypothetical protein
MPNFDSSLGIGSKQGISGLLRDTAARNASMNDPEEWKKRRKVKLEEYELPKIEAEGRQNILRQETANVPDLRKLDWEKSPQYQMRAMDLVEEKNKPDMMTAKTGAEFKEYLMGDTKHSRDLEVEMAQQAGYIYGKDLDALGTQQQNAARTGAFGKLASTPQYGGTLPDPNARVSGPAGTTTPNVLESEVQKKPQLSGTENFLQRMFGNWDNLENPGQAGPAPPSGRRGAAPLPTSAVPPERSNIDPMAGRRSEQVIQGAMNATPQRKPQYYEKWMSGDFSSGPGASSSLMKNDFTRFGTAPKPGTYLDDLYQNERSAKKAKKQWERYNTYPE